MLHCFKNDLLRSITCKLLAVSVALSPFGLVEQVVCFLSSTSVWLCISLTFHFRINSDCVGARSLLSKDVGRNQLTLRPNL